MVERKIINRGDYPNDGSGDAPWVANGKINDNLAELFDRTQSVGYETAFTRALKSSDSAAAWREGLGLYLPINVKAAPYNAKGDGVTDDTAAFAAAAADAVAQVRALYIPAGGYVINTLDVSGIPLVYGDGGIYGYASRLIHKSGATDDLITSRTINFRPVIRDLFLQGQKEVNLRNVRAIASVSTRYVFDVDSAPPTGYTGKEVFFFLLDSGRYHYLGSGMVQSASGNAVTLSSDQDWFATPTAAGGKLTTSCVACFGNSITEYGQTVQDPTRAGYAAIDFQGIGGYLKIEHVRISGFHVGIRHGLADALQLDNVFASKLSLAGIYFPIAAGGDARIISYEQGGNYEPQDGATATPVPLTGAQYRATKYGMYLSGSDHYICHTQLYGNIRDIFANFAFPLTIQSAHLDSSIRESIVLANSSQVTIGKLVARGCGADLTDTYPVILNVDSKLTVNQVYCSTVNSIKSSCLVKHSTADADTVFLDIEEIGGVITSGGYPVFEEKYNSLSGISYMRFGHDLVSGWGLSGGVWTFLNGASAYGMRMAGTGTTEDPFRLQLHAGQKDTPYVSLTNAGNLGINKTAPQYALDIGGEVGCVNAVVNGYLAFPKIAAPADTGTAGGRLFIQNNGSNKAELAIRFPSGAVQVIATEL